MPQLAQLSSLPFVGQLSEHKQHQGRDRREAGNSSSSCQGCQSHAGSHPPGLLSPVAGHLLFFCMLPCRHAASPTYPIVITKGAQGTQVLRLLIMNTQATTLGALSKVLSEWSVSWKEKRVPRFRAHRSEHIHPAPTNCTATATCEKNPKP